jgi:flavin-dependent dehydrogenase
MSARVDYAIVGGGPAGLAVAILAALAGRRAVVIERRWGALDKACGEGVMPPGVEWLRRMGVAIAADAAHPFRGIRYVDGAITATADFVEGLGLGIRRTELSRAMLARAAALGVEVRQGCAAGAFAEREDHVAIETGGGRVEARWLVGADGLHGQVRKGRGFAVATGARRRFGMRRHFAVPPWSEYVEVHWAEGVEAYVTPVGPNRVGVAFLWAAADKPPVGPPDGPPGDYETFLARFPALRSRLGPAAAAPETAILGGGPFATRVRPIARGRVLLVGDASGYLDAITGEGLALAFASAAALVDATESGDVAAYSRAWARIRRRHLLLTRAILRLAGHPALRRRVILALRARPDAFRALLALNTGAWGWGRALPGIGRLALQVLRSSAGRASGPVESGMLRRGGSRARGTRER